MKKVIILVLLAALVISSLSATAFALEPEQHVKELATKHEKVLECECVIYHRYCIVAIKTQNFNVKSEYDEYCNALTEQIKADCEVDNVVITRNPRAMHALAELSTMDEESRDKAIRELILRELERHSGGQRPVEPRFL